jgi:hypothetical protein
MEYILNIDLNIYKERKNLDYLSNVSFNSESKTTLKPIVYGKPVSKTFKRIPDEAIKESIAEIKKYYMDRSRGPNIFHAIFIPRDIYHSYKSLVKAKESKNELAISDAKIKIFTTSLNSGYITASIITIITELGILFSYAAPTLELISPITGIMASTVSAVIECRNIRRQIRFISKCSKDLKSLSSNIPNDKKVFFLEKYLGNASGIQMPTLAKLTNRVSPWFAEKVAISLPKLLDDIKQTKDLKLQKKSTEEAIELLKNTKIQALKKLRAQSLTLLASALVISCFACVLFGVPIIIPAALVIANLILTIGNHILYNGTNKHTGWDFKLRECTPVWVQAVKDKYREVFLKSSSV